MEQLGRDWPSSRKFILGVGGHGIIGRGLPRSTSIQTHAATFRRLIRAEPLDVSTLDDELTLCQRNSWVHVTELYDGPYLMRYSLASPLHKAYVSWFVPPAEIVTLRDNFQIYDLAIEVIQQFIPSQVLRCARKAGDGPKDSTQEALYQNEFYHGILKIFKGGVGITPEFTSASDARLAGRIDFFIQQTKWGIECTQDGDRLLAHSTRFADDGVYEQWLKDGEMDDYILLDFRVSMPVGEHPSMAFIWGDTMGIAHISYA